MEKRMARAVAEVPESDSDQEDRLEDVGEEEGEDQDAAESGDGEEDGPSGGGGPGAAGTDTNKGTSNVRFSVDGPKGSVELKPIAPSGTHPSPMSPKVDLSDLTSSTSTFEPSLPNFNKKNMKYRKQTFLPTKKQDKTKG